MFNRVVLVDQNNNEIGTEDKLDAHKKGLLHRAFSIFIFNDNNQILAIGGRVLNFVSVSESYLEARNSAINKIKDLNWGGGFFRKDIGFKAID